MNTPFQNHANEQTEFAYEFHLLKLAGKSDSKLKLVMKLMTPNQVQGNGGIKTIEKREFGTFTVGVNGIDYDYETAPALTILADDPIPVVVSHTGDAASYSWSARNDYPIVVSDQAALVH